jgi:hypothetical protein
LVRTIAEGPRGWNRPGRIRVGGDMPKYRLPLAVVSFALIAVACGSAGPASPSGPAPSGSLTPTAPPSPEGIDHPTGATDVVLQLEEGGGFVPIDFLANQAPQFTLFGDGRVVFQQTLTVFPEPGPDGIVRGNPWRTAQLDPGQVDELLTFALGQGGLGSAGENYGMDGIADASSSIFTINAGGLTKVVSVYALGMDDQNTPDLVARRAFMVLATRLRDFDKGGTIATDVYVPSGYRGVLIQREGDPQAKPMAWPWPDLKVTDFKANINAAGGSQLPHRTMTADEVAALKLGDIPGGVQGIILTGTDDKIYSFVLRPLLPSEKE